MRTRPRPIFGPSRRHGFSLIELSIVVAIMSIVSVLGLEAAANFVNRTSGAVTKERLLILDDAVVRFFKIYGRLPCPAARGLAPTDSSYGAEDCGITPVTGATTGNYAGGGIMFGAVPFRALNIPMGLSIDGFGSKINYVVTKNLTIAGTASGQFGYYDGTLATAALATVNGIGGIEIRSGILEQLCQTSKCQTVASPPTAYPATVANGNYKSGAAYVIFSNGSDRRGAVSARGATLANCVTNTATDGIKVDAQNCANAGTGGPTVTGDVTAPIPLNVFYDARFNSGLNLKNYFDDYIVWRSRAQL